MRRRHGGIAEGRVALQLLDHLLVFLAGLDAGHAEGDDLETSQVAPLVRQHVVEGVGNLGGVAGQAGIADTLVGDFGKGGLKRSQQLGLELVIQHVAGICAGDVAGDVGVEEDGVCHAVGVLAEAADADVDVDAGALIHHAEGDGGGSAVLVAGDLLGVEVVHALILGDLAAEGEALADLGKDLADALAQIAGENGGLGGSVVSKLTRLGAKLCDLALVDDDHALAVGHGDDGAAGNDVVAAAVRGAAALPLLAFDHNGIGVEGVTVKIFLPLIGCNACCSTQSCSDKTHMCISPFDLRACARSCMHNNPYTVYQHASKKSTLTFFN